MNLNKYEQIEKYLNECMKLCIALGNDRKYDFEKDYYFYLNSNLYDNLKQVQFLKEKDTTNESR